MMATSFHRGDVVEVGKCNAVRLILSDIKQFRLLFFTVHKLECCICNEIWTKQDFVMKQPINVDPLIQNCEQANTQTAD